MPWIGLRKLANVGRLIVHWIGVAANDVNVLCRAALGCNMMPSVLHPLTVLPPYVQHFCWSDALSSYWLTSSWHAALRDGNGPLKSSPRGEAVFSLHMTGTRRRRDSEHPIGGLSVTRHREEHRRDHQYADSAQLLHLGLLQL